MSNRKNFSSPTVGIVSWQDELSWLNTAAAEILGHPTQSQQKVRILATSAPGESPFSLSLSLNLDQQEKILVELVPWA